MKIAPKQTTGIDKNWSAFMKTSLTWNFRSIAGKMMMGFVLITLIGSVHVAQAEARDNHKSGGKHDNGRYEQRGRGHDRQVHNKRAYYRDRHGKRVYYRSYGYNGYRERAYYPPPPVIYAPPPPPGIRIFFPPIFIHP